MDGTRLARDNFLAQNANWLFHEKRSADCAINTAAFLARLFVTVRVEVIQVTSIMYLSVCTLLQIQNFPRAETKNNL
jgi:hypothetical protein